MLFCIRSYYGLVVFFIKFSFFWFIFLFFMIVLLFLACFFLGELGVSFILLLVFFYFLKKILVGFLLGDFFASDFLGLSIFFLTILVFFLIILSRSFDYFKFNSWFYFLSIFIFFFFFMGVVFLCRRFIVFYLAFEIAVVPIFIIIIGWGYSTSRLQSAIYIFLYTFFSSLPFLGFLIYMHVSGGSFIFSYFFNSLESKIFGAGFWVILSLVFIVKLPIFFFHLWLPKAHVEAPLLGSMVLAGVLLKLGGYGFYKVLYFSLLDFMSLKGLLGSFSLVGGCAAGLLCMRQTDLKSLVAYSSLVHIAPVFIAFLLINYYGFLGSLMIMFSHGLCSSCLFFILNLSYLKFSRRRYLLNRGGLLFFPFFSYVWFLFCICNIGFPPTFNFFSELFMVVRVFSYRLLIGIFIFVIMILGGFYSVILYLFYNHGEKKFFLNIYIARMKDILVAVLSLYYLFSFFLFCGLVIYLLTSFNLWY